MLTRLTTWFAMVSLGDEALRLDVVGVPTRVCAALTEKNPRPSCELP